MEGWAKAAEAGFTGEPHNPNLQPWSDTVCPPSAGRRTPKSAKANPSHVAEWTETQGGMSEILNQAAQERLLAGCGQGGLVPQVRQAPADLGEGGLEIGADHERDDVNGVLPGGERGFGLAQVAQRLLPTPLEFGRTQPRPRSVPSEEDACFALRRRNLLSRHLACKLASKARRRTVPTRERDVEPLMSCDKIGRPRSAGRILHPELKEGLTRCCPRHHR